MYRVMAQLTAKAWVQSTPLSPVSPLPYRECMRSLENFSDPANPISPSLSAVARAIVSICVRCEPGTQN